MPFTIICPDECLEAEVEGSGDGSDDELARINRTLRDTEASFGESEPGVIWSCWFPFSGYMWAIIFYQLI